MLALLVAGLLAGLPCAQAGARGPAPPPRRALLEAAHRVHNLAGRSGARPAAAGALRELRRATLPSLWLSPREIVAPAYGQRVFDAAAAAVGDLPNIGPSSTAGVRESRALILAATRDLARRAMTEAAGGQHELLASAERHLAAGNRYRASGRPTSAVRSYAVAWNQAFRALTRLVSERATTVPPSALALAAQGALGSRKIGLAGPRTIPSAPALRRNGKPELLFVGAEGCPFCAVERWGMIVALSQFGTFSHLQLMQSDTERRPSIRSFTFAGSRYRSPYIVFVPVEAFSNVRQGYGYAPLQRLTAAQRALLKRYDPPTQVPFIDVGNRYVNVDSTVQPTLLAGMSWTQVARSLTQPTSVADQAIGGEAEVLTAELCQVTGGVPRSVCASPTVQQYEAALPLLNGKGGGCPTPPPPPSTSERSRGQGVRAWPARCIV